LFLRPALWLLHHMVCNAGFGNLASYNTGRFGKAPHPITAAGLHQKRSKPDGLQIRALSNSSSYVLKSVLPKQSEPPASVNGLQLMQCTCTAVRDRAAGNFGVLVCTCLPAIVIGGRARRQQRADRGRSEGGEFGKLGPISTAFLRHPMAEVQICPTMSRCCGAPPVPCRLIG
jgi:hypothetical protein